jgi:hypothetical protein
MGFQFHAFFDLTYRRVMIHHTMKPLNFALAMGTNHSQTSPMALVLDLGAGGHERPGWNE